MATLIENAVLVLPDRLIEKGWLLIEQDRIAALGEAANQPTLDANAPRIDAGGNFLLPGLIDLHCDSIEKIVEPRPGVHFDVKLGLLQLDRQLAQAGITTQYHAVSFDDNEFGTRSKTFTDELIATLKIMPDSLIRHKVHARFEVTSKYGFEKISTLLATGEVKLVSLMDHSPGQGQFTTEEAYRAYVQRTYHRSDAELDAMIASKRKKAALVADHIEQIAKIAVAHGVALATHDDDTAEKVKGWPRLGVTMSEFPTTFAAAQQARELGLAVCMGAPNVVRGQSSGGNLSAMDAVQAGLCNILCADYYPAAMLTAVFKLAAANILSLPEAVRLVTFNPAQAVGLGADFGALEPGKIADLAVVRLNSHNLPHVARLFVAGRERAGFFH